MNYRKITIAALVLCFSLFSFAFPLLAEDTSVDTATLSTHGYEPLESIPGLTSDLNHDTAIDLGKFLMNAFNFLVAIAIVSAIVMITVGGFQYLTSAAVGSKEEAKTRISNALKGLILILLTYLILYTINPATVSLDFLTAVDGDSQIDLNRQTEVLGYQFRFIDRSGLNSETVLGASAFFETEELCLEERKSYAGEYVKKYEEIDECDEKTFNEGDPVYRYHYTTYDEPEVELLTNDTNGLTRSEREFSTQHFSTGPFCEGSRSSLEETFTNGIQPYRMKSLCFRDNVTTGPDTSRVNRDLLEEAINPYVTWTSSGKRGLDKGNIWRQSRVYHNSYSFLFSYENISGDQVIYRSRPISGQLACEEVWEGIRTRERKHPTYYTGISPLCAPETSAGTGFLFEDGSGYATQIKDVNTGKMVEEFFPTETECRAQQELRLEEEIKKYSLNGTCQKVSN